MSLKLLPPGPGCRGWKLSYGEEGERPMLEAEFTGDDAEQSARGYAAQRFPGLNYEIVRSSAR